LLAAAVALVVAGATVITWLAVDATAGLWVLAVLLATLAGLAAGLLWGRADRHHSRADSARLKEQLR